MKKKKKRTLQALAMMPRGLRTQIEKPPPLTRCARKRIKAIRAASDELLAQALRLQRKHGLPHRVREKAKKETPLDKPRRGRGRPLSDHPYPRIQPRSQDHLLAHWEHKGVHVEGCYHCYAREYMFFLRHPHLTMRYTRLGWDEKALAGRSHPSAGKLPFNLRDLVLGAVNRKTVNYGKEDE